MPVDAPLRGPGRREARRTTPREPRARREARAARAAGGQVHAPEPVGIVKRLVITLAAGAVMLASVATISANAAARIEAGGLSVWCVSDEISESGQAECSPFGPDQLEHT